MINPYTKGVKKSLNYKYLNIWFQKWKKSKLKLETWIILLLQLCNKDMASFNEPEQEEQ